MTEPVDNPGTEEPVTGYETFIEEAKRQLESDGVDSEVLDSAVYAMQKAKMVFIGEDLSTIRLDPVTKAVAHRVLHPETGIPLWQVSNPDGTIHYDHRPRLDDWTWLSGPNPPIV